MSRPAERIELPKEADAGRAARFSPDGLRLLLVNSAGNRAVLATSRAPRSPGPVSEATILGEIQFSPDGRTVGPGESGGVGGYGTWSAGSPLRLFRRLAMKLRRNDVFAQWPAHPPLWLQLDGGNLGRRQRPPSGVATSPSGKSQRGIVLAGWPPCFHRQRRRYRTALGCRQRPALWAHLATWA